MEIDPKVILEALGVGKIGAWAWKEFGKDIALKGAGSIWLHFKYDGAKKKYQDKVKKLYSTMRVLYKHESVSLDSQYVDLFILEEPEAYRRYGVDFLESNFDETVRFYDRSNRTEAVVVVNERDRLFVLGKPGAGKTTFLKKLASLAANEKKIDRVPIFVSLNSLAYSQKNLFDYIVNEFDVCGFPNAEKFIESILEKGKAIILFDGLDEIGREDSRQGQIIHEIENLIRQYHENKFIITCRNAANDYRFENFTYVEIADFTDYQVGAFVDKWFADDPEKSKKFQEDLGKDEHQNLKELTHNPLLLGMLCLVFDETSYFPTKRGVIYRDAIEALMKKWDKERGVQREKISGFTPSFEKKLLEFLAYEYLIENKIFFEKYGVVKKIDSGVLGRKNVVAESEDILDAIEAQHGLLIQRAEHVYSFSHLTFQEYFVAQYIVDRLETDQEALDNLFKYLYNPRWREVFPLVASLVEIPDAFFRSFVLLIQKPIKRNKLLNSMINRVDELSHELQVPGDIITSRMRTIALVVSINKIIRIVRKVASHRSLMLTRRMLQLLDLDEMDISLEKASEAVRIILDSSVGKGEDRKRLNKVLMLSIKKTSRFSDDFYTRQISNDELEKVRITLRDELRKSDKIATKQIIDRIKYELDERLYIGISLRVVLSFMPGFVGEFMRYVEEIDFPRTFADENDWRLYLKKLIHSVIPGFDEQEVELKEEYEADLEKFMQSNIFLLDCLRQADVTNYWNYVFLVRPYKV
jgi:predicted NACHT family NTPase